MVALALTWSTAGPAQAAHPYDRVPTARHRILGQHLTNHHTHMETWIVGWYPYQRRVRIHHHWRKKTFYGLRVSAQHCNRHRCWGRVVSGKLWSPHQPGRPVRSQPTHGSRLASAAPRRPVHPGHHVVRRPVELVRRLRRPAAAARSSTSSWTPAVQGSLAGGGVVLTKNLSARILFEGGVITAARAASAFEGPPGVAIGALGGCMTGVGAKGFPPSRVCSAT